VPEYNKYEQVLRPGRQVALWCLADGIKFIILIGFVLVVGAFFVAGAGFVGLILFSLLVTIPFVFLAAWATANHARRSQRSYGRAAGVKEGAPPRHRARWDAPAAGGGTAAR
jgi:uncharacterized membrane protein